MFFLWESRKRSFFWQLAVSNMFFSATSDKWTVRALLSTRLFAVHFCGYLCLKQNFWKQTLLSDFFFYFVICLFLENVFYPYWLSSFFFLIVIALQNGVKSVNPGVPSLVGLLWDPWLHLVNTGVNLPNFNFSVFTFPTHLEKAHSVDF